MIADIWPISSISSTSNEVLGITLRLSKTAITLKRCNEMVLIWEVRYVGIMFLSQVSPIKWYISSPPSLQFFLISIISSPRKVSHDQSFVERCEQSKFSQPFNGNIVSLFSNSVSQDESDLVF